MLEVGCWTIRGVSKRGASKDGNLRKLTLFGGNPDISRTRSRFLGREYMEIMACVSTALLEIEPRLRRIKGYRNLPKLREALKQRLNLYREAA